MQQYDLTTLLDHIPVSQLEYQEWINVGMALHHEGYSVSVWDSWSRDDKRYKAGDCEKKWRTFGNGSTLVTGGTIYEYARRFGWQPSRDQRIFDWEDEIEYDGDDPAVVIPDKAWVEAENIDEAKGEDKQELITYLETLFKPDECVGFVMKSMQDGDKYRPADVGRHTFTAAQLIQRLKKETCIEDALEKYDKAAGAWIRFNPLDGKGVKNDNVTSFRYALVESDGMSMEEQFGLYKELNLPIAALVSSAGKSLHAIVRIDAFDRDEYRKRVDYLYDVCEKNGIVVDKQNKNPSRMSRMPGVIRYGSRRQKLVATNIGAKDYLAWVDWMNEKADDYPESTEWCAVKDNLPELADELISGILRKGHKMLIAGPSKAGKSFALIELAIAIATGSTWMNHKCTKGKVLYVNLEVDEASFFHRVDAVSKAMKADIPKGNLTIWNLRGENTAADRLIPRLIHRATSKGYTAIILDPLYKINQGDENSAAEIGAFFNQLDKICKQLKASVILCHHHSKGSQGNKVSIDRASGSGVFARDPDALLDLMQIEPKDVEKDIPETATAWRISYTLREFPSPRPIEVLFDYPVHTIAEGLEDAKEKYGADSETKRARGSKTVKDNKNKRVDRLIQFIMNWPEIRTGNDHMTPKVSDAIKYFTDNDGNAAKGFSIDTIRRWASEENAEFKIENGYLYLND